MLPVLWQSNSQGLTSYCSAFIVHYSLFSSRFDDFRKGAPHLMPNEISDHQKEYRQAGIWEKFSYVVDQFLEEDEEEDRN